MQYLFILPSRRHELRSVIELFISEIQADVNRNFNKVQHVEEEAQEEYETRAAVSRLDYLPCNAAGIPHEQEHLEEKALPLRRPRHN